MTTSHLIAFALGIIAGGLISFACGVISDMAELKRWESRE